jgi:hypothetical protein
MLGFIKDFPDREIFCFNPVGAMSAILLPDRKPLPAGCVNAVGNKNPGAVFITKGSNETAQRFRFILGAAGRAYFPDRSISVWAHTATIVCYISICTLLFH